jgi:hypothetical protein
MLRGVTLPEEVVARKQVVLGPAAYDSHHQRGAGERLRQSQYKTIEERGWREVRALHPVSTPRAAPQPGRRKQQPAERETSHSFFINHTLEASRFPQVLVNAVTGEVELAQIALSGEATYQDLTSWLQPNHEAGSQQTE